MAISRVGSSIVAKAQPGGAMRGVTERRLTKPEIMGKGAVGSLGRDMVDEPLVATRPAGTERVVRATPSIGSSSAQDIGLLPATMGATQIAQQQRQGASVQPTMGGNGVTSARESRASVISRGGTSATAVSGATPPRAELPVLGLNTEFIGPTKPPSVSVQAPRPKDAGTAPFFNALGGKAAIATEPDVVTPPAPPKNFSQAVADTVATVLRSSAPEVSSALRSYAQNQDVTGSGVGSITKPQATVKAVSNYVAPKAASVAKTVSSAPATLRSTVTNTVNNLKSSAKNTASKAVSKLRSLFGR